VDFSLRYTYSDTASGSKQKTFRAKAERRSAERAGGSIALCFALLSHAKCVL
jgi:hypothetical protein